MKRLKIEGEEIKAREEDASQHFCTIGGFNASNLHFKTFKSRTTATRVFSFSVRIEQKHSLKKMKRTSKVQRRQTVWPTFLCTHHMCHCLRDPPGQIFVTSASKSQLVRRKKKGHVCT